MVSIFWIPNAWTQPGTLLQPDCVSQRILSHNLRHTYAVMVLQSGDDIKTVQENLGHATAAFTLDVYGHVTAQMKKASADRMEKKIQAVSGL